MKSDMFSDLIGKYYYTTLLAALIVLGFLIFLTSPKETEKQRKKAFVTGVLCGMRVTQDIYLEGNLTNRTIDEVFRRVYAMPGLPEDYKP